MKRLALLAITLLLLPAVCCKSVEASYATDAPAYVVSEAAERTVNVFSSGGSCLGVLVATGKILTAAHCGGTNITVNGKPAKVLKEDKEADLLLLQTETPFVSPVRISTKIFKGQHVLSSANWQVGGVGDMKGITDWQRVNYVHGEEFFMTRLHMLQGYSGSIVWNYEGELIGMEQQILGKYLDGMMSPNALPGVDGLRIEIRVPHIQYSLAIHGARIKKFLEPA